MSVEAVAILVLMILIVVVLKVAMWGFEFVYREGWDHGYGAGYDDRDDETIRGEKPGTRRGRSTL